MEDQTSWKAHTFTLLVFAGIVVLCSIFFILGMLVGRDQGQKIAAAAAPPAALKADAKLAPKEDKPDFTFYDSVKKEEPAALQPPPAKTDPPRAAAAPAPKTEPAPEPAVTSKPSNSLNYQIAAFGKASEAEKLLNTLKKKGFKGYILSPASDDPRPLYRVQVGPFSDPIAAQDAKKKLKDAGYEAYQKK
jgi:cell division septation protein DedD